MMDSPSSSSSTSVLQTLRRESLDIYNRLHSIAADALFVTHVHAAYPAVPLVPNLRCGAWYTDPAHASPVPAYFKSTDGHTNNCTFNLRRPNLQLLPLLAHHRAVLLVDSTRAGKRIPDALSKTVPIWCAVVNRAVKRRFPAQDKDGWDTQLYTPPRAVSAQEHHQIEQRVDAWADALFKSSFDLPDLPAPLRPFWITPATTTFPSAPSPGVPPAHLAVICLSASHADDARRPAGFAYIQGSGDDHELWGRGLTPGLYWRHRDALLAAGRAELPGVVERVVVRDRSGGGGETGLGIDGRVGRGPTEISKVRGRMRVCAFAELGGGARDEEVAYVFLSSPTPTTTTSAPPHVHTLTLPLAPKAHHKTHLTHAILPRALRFIGAQLALGRSVCVVSGASGDAGGGYGEVGEAQVSDEAIAVLLAALVVFFDDEGGVAIPPSLLARVKVPDPGSQDQESHDIPTPVSLPPGIDKQRIRVRLEWVIACRAGVNPARATLKLVNAFFMSGGRGRGG